MKRREFIRQVASVIGLVAAAAVPGGLQAGSKGRPHADHSCAPGYGKCSKCSCERYDAKGLTCRCGHGFYEHYV